MKLLVVGHSLVIDTNRGFWNFLSAQTSSNVDIIAPSLWASNLKKEISFESNLQYDQNFNQIFKIDCFNKGNGSFFFFSPFQIFRVLNQKKYDLIYLNQETWSLATLIFILMKLISINSKTKLFLCVAQNIKKKKLAFLHPYERFISKFIYSFLYCSTEVKEVLEWKKIKTRKEYFPLPYDDSIYRVKTTTNNQDVLKIGFLGRISEDKGILVLLAACDILKRKNVEFKLIVGGNGPLVTEIKRRDYAQYLGLIPHNLAHTFYDQIDVFILPSQTKKYWKEQFGRVIVESFAKGVPVIGSNSGSIPEVLNFVEWPWIFYENSPEDLAEKIINFKNEQSKNDFKEKLEKSISLNFNKFSQTEVSKSIYKIFTT